MSVKKRSPKISGLIFLPLVLAVYAVLYRLSPDKTLLALQKSGIIFLKILPILVIVILLLGVINHFFDARKISRHLGEESGLKGWIYATVGGILSHGPSYVWYPMLAQIRDHGAKEGLIVTFFYARAIKLPLLPIMISYFGWRFTLVFSLWLIATAVLQGAIYEKWLSPARR
ncbi:MAG: permease [Campylobacteraceae bacterium 4484_4]|nr:MAG: permease [Campylobacteraceae bacterium 4484_4]